MSLNVISSLQLSRLNHESSYEEATESIQEQGNFIKYIVNIPAGCWKVETMHSDSTCSRRYQQNYVLGETDHVLEASVNVCFSRVEKVVGL